MKPPLAVRRAQSRTPVGRRLHELAIEFDEAAEYYSDFSGEHNRLLEHEARRAAAQLRLVATLVATEVYSQRQGVDWVRAGWRIITAIGRANLT